MAFCAPHPIDGDTVIVCREHIRIAAIDAPEMPGHCRRGRVCTPGDPFAAKLALTRILASGRVEIARCGFDHYGRTLATLSVNGRDVGTAMVAGGFAVWRYHGC